MSSLPRLTDADLDRLDALLSTPEMENSMTLDAIQGLLRNIARSLKPQGRIGVVDFLPGGGGPGPASDDRVNPDTIVSTFEAAGLRLHARETIPPFQYLLVFEKVAPPAPVTPQTKRKP